MLPGNALKLLDAFELTLERALILEPMPPHDFGRSQRASGLAASQPDLAITAAADLPQQFVIRNRRSAFQTSGRIWRRDRAGLIHKIMAYRTILIIAQAAARLLANHKIS